ncbi:MAG: DUF2953 domain-containing protein [Lachnospiraceae bacterium]|nr:DUF2953 domain-containing protein [Lachnospiraceae bacterium]
MAALPIILNILKITGIVLASILGFVLILLILVLFVPVRYRIRFTRTGVDGDEPVIAGGYVSWLLHILHVTLAYPAEYLVTVRVFGIPVFRKSLDKKDSPDQDQEKPDDTEPAKPEETEAGDDVDSPPASQAEEEFLSQDDLPDDGFEESDEESDEENKDSIFSRIADLIHNIQCTMDGFCSKIKDIANNVHYYHNLLTSELFERTFARCKKKVIRLLKSILPRKGDIRLEMGFDDPYTTGEVLAIAGILYPVIGEHVHIYGNFDESVIRGGGYVKGRIYLIMVVMLGLYYLTDRDLKKTIRLFKKEPVKKKNHRSGRRSNGRDQ